MTAADPLPLARNRNYLALVAAQGTSVLAGQVVSVALPLLTLALTGSALHAGLVAAAGAAPYVVLGLAAGALVDRWDRRGVLLACNAVRALVLLAVVVAHAADLLVVAHLYLLAVVSGTAYVFFTIAELAVLPRVVDRSQLVRASSVNSVTESAGGLAGPGLGGALVAFGRSQVAGGVLALFVAGLSYALSALSLLVLTADTRAERVATRTTVRQDVVEGLRFLRARRGIRRVALLSAALNVLFSPAYLAVIVLLRDDLHASPAVVGLVFSLGGAAGILGGLSAARLAGRVPPGPLIAWSLAAWALAVPALALAPVPAVLVAGWVLVTLISPVYDVTQLSYRLSLIPDELQGRVNSAFRFIAWGLRPLALAAGAGAVAAWGARPTLWVIAGGMALVAVIGGPLTARGSDT